MQILPTISSITPQFKGIYKAGKNFSNVQHETIKDITDKLRTPREDGKTPESTLKNSGFDVLLCDSIIREDSIDMKLIKDVKKINDGSGNISYNRETVNIGTYNRKIPFNIEDIKTGIREKAVSDLFLQFLFGIAITGLSIFGAIKCSNASKNKITPNEKIINVVNDSVKNITDTIKTPFKI